MEARKNAVPTDAQKREIKKLEAKYRKNIMSAVRGGYMSDLLAQSVIELIIKKTPLPKAQVRPLSSDMVQAIADLEEQFKRDKNHIISPQKEIPVLRKKQKSRLSVAEKLSLKIHESKLAPTGMFDFSQVKQY